MVWINIIQKQSKTKRETILLNLVNWLFHCSIYCSNCLFGLTALCSINSVDFGSMLWSQMKWKCSFHILKGKKKLKIKMFWIFKYFLFFWYNPFYPSVGTSIFFFKHKKYSQMKLMINRFGFKELVSSSAI